MSTYSLTCDAGCFRLTGQDVGLRYSGGMYCGAGEFTLTGNDAGLWRQGAIDYTAEVVTLAQCAIIKRTDGTVVRVTAHVDDITLTGDTYSSSPGVAATAHAAGEGLSVDNQDIVGLFESSVIDPDDLRAGLYRGAEVWIFEVDYVTPDNGIKPIDHGYVGGVQLNRGAWIAEFRSLTSLLDLEIGNRYERRCRHVLGDSNCGVNLADYTVTSSVSQVDDNQTFIDLARTEAANYWRYGKLTWTSGNNTGIAMDVKTSTATGSITLLHAMPFDIACGDGFTLSAGCNHLLKLSGDEWGTTYTGDCIAKFSNAAKFGGFPEMIGDDALIKGPA